MANKSAKTAAEKPAVKRAVRPKAPAAHQIEKVNEEILKRLQSLDIEHPLQADIEWCLGSYRSDNNPSGLYIMAERALQVFTFELTKNPKSVPARLIKDIERALKNK